MPGGFSFPPPPPPPRSNSTEAHIEQATRGSHGAEHGSRGRGQRGGHHGQSRQSSGPDQHARTDGGQQASPSLNSGISNLPPGAHINPRFQALHNARPVNDRGSHNTDNSLKRKRGASDGPWKRGRGHRPHPIKGSSRAKDEVAPAVPSFGQVVLPQQLNAPTPDPMHSSDPPRKSLGLISTIDDTNDTDESSQEEDNDEDEEAAFQGLPGTLTFEHNGDITTLETAADVRDWIKERRRQYPTQRRIAEKQDEVHERIAERRRIEYETKQAVLNPPLRPTRPKTIYFEKRGEGREHFVQPDSQDNADLFVPPPEPTSNKAEDPGSDNHSSSPSSDSGSDSSSDSSDSAPDQGTAKQPLASPTAEPVKLCASFSATGRCRFGSQCRFRHVRSQSNALQARKSRQKPGRKTLYEKLIEQDEDAENKLAVQAIRYLGDLGFFRADV